MNLMRCSFLWFLVTILTQVFCSENYYFRSYNGSVPEDAFVAGQDINGKSIHVGHVYLAEGSIPGQIKNGSPEILITWDGPVKKDTNVYILCGSQTSFRWLYTGETHLHLDLLQKRPVLGGFRNGYGYYYVGRVFREGETIIGKINQFNRNDSRINFVENGAQTSEDWYEVLHYVDAANGYYWREYNNTIPEDAVIGGRDKYCRDIYIGQVYVENVGVIPGEIHPGVSQIEVEYHEIVVADKYVKILCGIQHKFRWLPTNADRLHEDLNGSTPVLGGHENGWGYYYIGKFNEFNGDKLGKINQFANPYAYYNNMMLYVDEHERKSSLSYYVLIIDN